MSQSPPPPDTEDQHLAPTPPLKCANGTDAVDDLCPNLGDEVSAARGVGVFASTCLLHTLSLCSLHVLLRSCYTTEAGTRGIPRALNPAS